MPYKKFSISTRAFVSILLALSQLTIVLPMTMGNSHIGTFSTGASEYSAVFGIEGGNDTSLNLTIPDSAYVLNSTLSIEGLPVTFTGGHEDTTDADFSECAGIRNVTISGGSVTLNTSKGYWSQSTDSDFGKSRLENVVVSGGVKLAKGAKFSVLLKDKQAAPTFTSEQHPMAAVNSKGELIVVWEDFRGTSLDIYARRFDSIGNALGAEFPVCTETGRQYNPALAVDGADNFYVLWQDQRSTDWDIRGLKFDATGAQVGNEFVVCDASGDQSRPALAIDSGGKMLAAWDDYRNDLNYQIRSILLNSDGTPAGIEQEHTTFVVDHMWASACALPSGFALAWQNSSNFTGADIEGRILNSQGSAIGSTFNISASSFNQSSVRLAAGAGGKWVAVWEDRRGGSDFNVYGRWFDSNGIPTTAETPVCLAAGDQRYPCVSALSSGETVIAWEDCRGADSDVYFKRYDSSFNAIGTEVDFCWEKRDQDTPAVAFNSTGSFFGVWADYRDGVPNIRMTKYGAPRNVYTAGELVSPEIPCYAAKYGTLGLCITLPQVPRARVNTTGFQVDVLDGRELNVLQTGVLPGGNINVDNRYHSSIRLRVKMWTVDENITPVLRKWSVGTGLEDDLDFTKDATFTGAKLKGGEIVLEKGSNFRTLSNDIPIQNSIDNHQQPSVARFQDGSGDFVVAYQEGQGDDTGVLARKFNKAGTPIGGERLVCNTTGPQENPAVAVDLNGQITIVWSDNRSGTSKDIYGHRYDSSLTPVGNEFLICGTAEDQVTPAIVADLENNFIVVWVDCTKVYTLTFFQKFYPDATPYSPIIQLSWTQWNLLQPVIGVDGYNRFYIAWVDFRGGYGGNYDIYARNFYPDCTPVHEAQDIVVCEKVGDQWAPSITVDPDGNFVVAWEDWVVGTNPDIYARKFDWNGTPLTSEFPITKATGMQRDPSVAFDSKGNFLAAWQSFVDAFDIIGCYFGSNGAALTQEFVICNVKNVKGEPADQISAYVTCGTDDDFLVAWQDGRPKYDVDVWAKAYGVSDYITSGTYLSQAYDLGHAPLSLDEAGWNGSFSGTTGITASMRTSSDAASWSSWEDIAQFKNSFTSTPERYVQWQFNLASSGVGTPVLQNYYLRYTTYATNGTLLSPPYSVPTKISEFELMWNATLSGEKVVIEVSQDDGMKWTAWDKADPPQMDLGLNESVFRYRVFLYSNGSGNPVLDDVFMGFKATSFPRDVWLDFGMDGIPDWNVSGELNVSYNVGGFETILNEMLTAAGGNGTGNLTVPIILHSETAGIVRISNISVDFNVPPIIRSASPSGTNVTILETETQRFSVSAYDSDNDKLTYTWKVDGKTVESLNDYYIFQTDFKSSGTYNVSVIVSDSYFFVNRTWSLVVRNNNRIPTMEWNPERDVRINETEKVSFWVKAGDADGENLSVAWMLDGLKVGNITEYEYSTDYNSSGTHRVTVNITDGIDTVTHNWTVTVVNRNRAPEVRSVTPPVEGVPTFQEGKSQNFTIDAFDPDNDTLVYTWKVNGNVVANFFGGYFTCKKEVKVGMNLVRVEITDGNATVAREWNVKVTAATKKDDIKTGGSPTMLIGAAIAIVALVAVLGLYMMSRKKAGGKGPSPEAGNEFPEPDSGENIPEAEATPAEPDPYPAPEKRAGGPNKGKQASGHGPEGGTGLKNDEMESF